MLGPLQRGLPLPQLGGACAQIGRRLGGARGGQEASQERPGCEGRGKRQQASGPPLQGAETYHRTPAQTAKKRLFADIFGRFTVAGLRGGWYGLMLVTGNAATGLPVDGRTESMNSSRTRQARITLLILAALAAALAVGVTAAGADPTVDSKRAEAQRIRAEVEQIYLRVEKAAEAYNLANIELAQIDADLSSNARHLVVATKSLGVARERVAQRLRALYVNGDGAGAVEIILGAKSLDDILTRLDVAQRVGEQDATVLGDVKQFRREVRGPPRNARAARARAGGARRRQGGAEAVRRPAAGGEPAAARLRAGRDPGDGGGGARRQALLEAQARARLAAQRTAAQAASVAAADAQTEYGSGEPAATTCRPPSTPGSSASPCSTSACRTSGVAAARAGFDCSGLIMYVYAQVGVSLPHNAADAVRLRRPGRATTSSRPATSSSSTGSVTPASTSAATSSSTRRTRATSSRSRQLSSYNGYVGARRLLVDQRYPASPAASPPASA